MRPKVQDWLFAGVSITALGGAVVAQKVFHLLPCTLCYWQRYVYATLLSTALISLLRPSFSKTTVWMYPLILCAGTGIALFHSGVERKWWRGLAGCSAGGQPTDLAELRTAILSALPAKCDEISWEFLGLSMANYNTLLSAVLLMIALFSLVRRHTSRT